jgi:hypothetical protein
MSDKNTNPEMRAAAPITMIKVGRGYRCIARVDGEIVSMLYKKSTRSAAFTAFHALISKAVR